MTTSTASASMMVNAVASGRGGQSQVAALRVRSPPMPGDQMQRQSDRPVIDLTVLIHVPVAERHRRTAARDEAGFLQRWHATWDAFEAHYFERLRPPWSFDLVIDGTH